MKDKPPRRNPLERLQDLNVSYRELAGTQFEERERGPEAEARHQLYVSRAYATLAPTRELLWCGARAGLQVGAAVLAIETGLLIAVLAAALSIDTGEYTFLTLYGQTPLAGTVFEPLWPILLSTPALLFFSVIGALAALMLRLGCQRRRLLDRYFNPVSPQLDFATFWVLITVLLMLAAYLFGFLTAQSDPTGILIIALATGGLLAVMCHRLWLLWYLPLIQARGSVSMDAIKARIQPQL